MRKFGNIIRYSADEIRRKLTRGESRTDWKRVDALAQEEVERLADEEEGPLSEDWESKITLGLPPPKQNLRIRVDSDVLEWFEGQGKDYQTRINAVLRAFVQSRRRLEQGQAAKTTVRHTNRMARRK